MPFEHLNANSELLKVPSHDQKFGEEVDLLEGRGRRKLPRPVEHVFFGAFLVAGFVFPLLLFGGVKMLMSLHGNVAFRSWITTKLDI